MDKEDRHRVGRRRAVGFYVDQEEEVPVRATDLACRLVIRGTGASRYTEILS